MHSRQCIACSTKFSMTLRTEILSIKTLDFLKQIIILRSCIQYLFANQLFFLCSKTIPLTIIYLQEIWLFQCKIDFYFTHEHQKRYFPLCCFSVRPIFISPNEHQKAIYSRVAKSQVKIPLLVFMSEIKIDLTLKKSNFLFLLCLKSIKIVYSRGSAIWTRQKVFPSRQVCVKFDASSLLCLLVMILVVDVVCNWKITWNYVLMNKLWEICYEEMQTGDRPGVTCIYNSLSWRFKERRNDVKHAWRNFISSLIQFVRLSVSVSPRNLYWLATSHGRFSLHFYIL